jgi:hypothetical protein
MAVATCRIFSELPVYLAGRCLKVPVSQAQERAKSR